MIRVFREKSNITNLSFEEKRLTELGNSGSRIVSFSNSKPSGKNDCVFNSQLSDDEYSAIESIKGEGRSSTSVQLWTSNIPRERRAAKYKKNSRFDCDESLSTMSSYEVEDSNDDFSLDSDEENYPAAYSKIAAEKTEGSDSFGPTDVRRKNYVKSTKLNSSLRIPIDTSSVIDSGVGSERAKSFHVTRRSRSVKSSCGPIYIPMPSKEGKDMTIIPIDANSKMMHSSYLSIAKTSSETSSGTRSVVMKTGLSGHSNFVVKKMIGSMTSSQSNHKSHIRQIRVRQTPKFLKQALIKNLQARNSASIDSELGEIKKQELSLLEAKPNPDYPSVVQTTVESDKNILQGTSSSCFNKVLSLSSEKNRLENILEINEMSEEEHGIEIKPVLSDVTTDNTDQTHVSSTSKQKNVFSAFSFRMLRKKPLVRMGSGINGDANRNFHRVIGNTSSKLYSLKENELHRGELSTTRRSKSEEVCFPADSARDSDVGTILHLHHGDCTVEESVSSFGQKSPSCLSRMRRKSNRFDKSSFNDGDKVLQNVMAFYNCDTRGVEILNIDEEVKSSSIIVRVEASTVSEADLATLHSSYPDELPIATSLPLGFDFIGIIEHCDDTHSVNKWKLNDRVASLLKLGRGNAQYLSKVNADQLVKVPKTVDASMAACLIQDYLKSFQALHTGISGKDRHSNKSLEGKSVLIIGGIANSSQAMIELARLHGASFVYTTAIAKHHDFLVSINAIPLDSDPNIWLPEVRGMMDIVVDAYGEDNYSSSLALNSKGKLVCVKTAYPYSPSANQGFFGLAGSLLTKVKSSLMVQTYDYNLFEYWDSCLEESKTDLSYLFQLLESKKIRPKIADTLPLSKVYRAHEFLQSPRRIQGYFVCEPWTFPAK